MSPQFGCRQRACRAAVAVAKRMDADKAVCQKAGAYRPGELGGFVAAPPAHKVLHQRRHIPWHGGRVVDPARGGIDHWALVLAVIAAYAAPPGSAYQNDAVQLADVFL